MKTIKVNIDGKLLYIDKSIKDKIDSMSQIEMARAYRFTTAGDSMFIGDNGNYFMHRFKSLGGMTPSISKMIGW